MWVKDHSAGTSRFFAPNLNLTIARWDARSLLELLREQPIRCRWALNLSATIADKLEETTEVPTPVSSHNVDFVADPTSPAHEVWTNGQPRPTQSEVDIALIGSAGEQSDPVDRWDPDDIARRVYEEVIRNSPVGKLVISPDEGFEFARNLVALVRSLLPESEPPKADVVLELTNEEAAYLMTRLNLRHAGTKTGQKIYAALCGQIGKKEEN